MSSMGPPLGTFGGPRRNPGMRRAHGDTGVQKTNDDAQSTKLSCAALGYFTDELLPLLAKCLPSRKPPLINRGTWARHAAMRQVTTDFVTGCVERHAEQRQQQRQQQQQQGCAAAGCSSSAQPVCQVVVLGAGSDSSWFSLQHQGWDLLSSVRYIELDYPEVVSKKARAVLSAEKLLQLLPHGTTARAQPAGGGNQAAADSNGGPVTWTKQAAAAAPADSRQPSAGPQQPQSHQPPPPRHLQQQEEQQQQQVSSGPVPPAAVAAHVQELHGSAYSCVGADLRSLVSYRGALSRATFDARLPTLYLSECVLVYLESGDTQQLLEEAAAAALAGGCAAAVAIYEQTRPHDAFGCTMISNLEARGCPLRSVLSVPTPAAQEQRLLSKGWAVAAAADMAAVYYGSSSSSGGGGNGSVTVARGEAAGCGWLREPWQAERRRIEKLELLDELEEWRLLQEHYCLALGVAGDGSGGGEMGWLARKLRLPQLQALGGGQPSEQQGS